LDIGVAGDNNGPPFMFFGLNCKPSNALQFASDILNVYDHICLLNGNISVMFENKNRVVRPNLGTRSFCCSSNDESNETQCSLWLEKAGTRLSDCCFLP